MADFRIAHYAFRQTDPRAVRRQQRLRVFLSQLVVERLIGERDGVAFADGRITPAVNNDECQWSLLLRQIVSPVGQFEAHHLISTVASARWSGCSGALATGLKPRC